MVAKLKTTLPNQRAIDYIESTIIHRHDEVKARLKEVADIHAQYAACHSGGPRRIALNLAEQCKLAIDWLDDKRQHPRSIAVWSAEITGRLVTVLNACGHVNGSTPMELGRLLD